jgi:tetratricopeptide (TPR) repeat protein
MNAIRSSEKALERIRSSGSFPTYATPERGPGAGGWVREDGGPRLRLRREQEITVGDSDDEDEMPSGRAGAGSRAADSVHEDKVRELNAAGLDAMARGDTARARQMLEDALAALKKGGVADVGLTVSTYGNYGAMLLATSKNTDKAVDVLADAVVRISRVPPEVQSADLERSLQSMHSLLASAIQSDTGDIRLECLFQYTTGAQLERQRQGFECLEHLRVAHDLSRTCMGVSHPMHKAISGAFDRAKKAYAAGATTFQSKKVQAEQKKGSKNGVSGKGGAGNDNDFLGGGDDGLGLFEKGLSTDVWSALKDAGKAKAKGSRVTTGTAAKASLADRNLQSRGESRGDKREPSPDLFAPSAGKKSSFLANLLGDASAGEPAGSKMPSIGQKPGSQQKMPPSSWTGTSKRDRVNKDRNPSRRPVSPVLQPNFAAEDEITKPRGAGSTHVRSEHQATPAQVGSGGLKEISVQVPVAKVGSSKAPSASSTAEREASDRSKTGSAASSASTDASRAPRVRSPVVPQVDSEDEHVGPGNVSRDEQEEPFSTAEAKQSSIDDMIGELSLGKDSVSPKQASPKAQQVAGDSDDDDAPKFVTLAKHDKEVEKNRHVAAGDSAASRAQKELDAGDLEAARKAMVEAGREWLAAGVDKTSDLAILAGRLALGLAREKISSGDFLGARDALETAASEWKKAGHNRADDIAAVEAQIGEEAIKTGRFEEAADIYARALAVAKESGDLEAQAAAYAKLGSAYRLVGRNQEAIDAIKRGLDIAENIGDESGQIAAYEVLGHAYKALGRTEDAVQMFTRSLQIAQQSWNVSGQGRAHRGLGDSLAALGRHAEAADMYAKAQEVAQRTGDVSGIGAAMQGLANVHTALGKHDEAANVLRKALEIAEHSGDSKLQGTAMNALGCALTALGRSEEQKDGEKTRATLHHYDQAVELYSKVLEMAEQTSDTALKCSSCNALSVAYDALGRHKEAAEMSAEALKIAEQLGDDLGQATARSALGNAYRGLGKFDEAVAMHSKCLKLGEQCGDAGAQAAAYMGLANAYKSLGRYAEALCMLDQANAIAQNRGFGLNPAHVNEWVKSKTASLTIQCNFRMHLARLAMLAAMKREFSKNIVPVQAAVRQRLARARYAIQLKRKRAALKIENTILIQSKFRRALANHRWGRVLRGVGHICARIRANQECRHASKRNATIGLQACVRARLQASQGAKVIEQGTRDKLSCVLQACCRRYGPRKIHRNTIASVLLQAATRRRRSIETFCARKAVLGASSHARAAVCRRKYAQTVAGLLMAAYLRARVVRKKWQTVDGAALRKTPTEMDVLDKERKESQRLAVESIQASIRRLMQRKIGDEQMQNARETDSCCLLQAARRRQCARREYARLLACKREMKETASKRLSHFAKASVARRRHARQRGASVQLQASLRRSLGQSSGTSHMQESREQFSCQCLQATCRRSVSREAHRKSLAARTIHAAMLRRTVDQESRRGKEARATLERFFKAATFCRKYVEKQIAVRILQAVLRRSAGQVQGKGQMEESRKNLTMHFLQAVCRRSLARQAHRKDLGVRTLQAASRRRRACQARKQQEYSASCIERLCKAALALIRHAEQRGSAMKLQAALRRRLGQLYGQSVMEDSKRESASEHLDSFCRRMLARVAYCKDVAARKIQAAIRRRHARHGRTENTFACASLQQYIKAMLIRKQYEDQRSASRFLQAAVRRHKGQADGLSQMEKIRQGSSAQSLEAACRRTLARESHRRLLAAQTLQAAVRRRQDRLSGQEEREAHATLEHIFRAALARQKYSVERCAAVTLQAVLRGNNGQIEGQSHMNASRRERAAQALQAQCRRLQAKQYRDAVHRAYETLSRMAKSAVARIEYQEQAAFRKVPFIVTSYSKHTRALNFQNSANKYQEQAEF